MTRVLRGKTYVDILYDRRKFGDLEWVTRDWTCAKYRFSKERSPKQIQDEVFGSPRVQHVIKEICDERKMSQEEVTKAAGKILEEMSHNLQLSAIRLFGFLLAKFKKQVYTSIYVNLDGIEQLRDCSVEYPVLLLPTHRSYVDFLLISYVCYHFNLPIPAIAAGLDFLGLKALNLLLRNSGAFFIRRSFGGDKLYWAVFTEYVQNQLSGGEAPLEFFVEGTRSRTAKSLNPKLGLLQTTLELFFTGQVSDITVVPISITYDRTLEEMLYAYELLGVPKPKESTTGLIKARSILRDNFGSIFMHIGDPVSVREFCGKQIDRSLHNLQPRFKFALTPVEQQVTMDLSVHIIRTHQRNLVLSHFPLVCLVMGDHLREERCGATVENVIARVAWLEELVNQTGACITSPDGVTRWDQVQQQICIHSNLFTVTSDMKVELTHSESESTHPSDTFHSLKLSTKVIEKALPYLAIYHYGNQVLQVLVHYAMVALIIVTTNTSCLSLESLFSRYQVLQKIFQREFVFENKKSLEGMLSALEVFQNQEILCHEESRIFLDKTPDSLRWKLNLLASVLSPFLEGYKIACQHLLSSKLVSNPETLSETVKQCQVAVEGALLQGEIRDYRSLSLDILNNCVHNLVKLGAVTKEPRNGQTLVVPNGHQLDIILQDINSFVQDPLKRWPYYSGTLVSSAVFRPKL
ncbi:dihydroxyacetone phosphate acyltransferase-like [Tachypleus tridentatus]|uniref:dihydroxyacetone phosphate acyltransferase-like n=1 Tax=Tachypleus tridentatus TaxID=6853 RepID=UPI003FD57FD4